MKISNIVSFAAAMAGGLLITATALQAGTPAAAAPAPLAGAGLVYLATGGAAAGAWLAVKAIGKRLRNRKD